MPDHDDNLLDSLLALSPEELAAYQARQEARDQALADAFEEMTDLLPSYQEKQHRRYTAALAMGWTDTAADALWRAASSLDLLTTAEGSHSDLTPARVSDLLARLGWE
jgi:hypothetical protein